MCSNTLTEDYSEIPGQFEYEDDDKSQLSSLSSLTLSNSTLSPNIMAESTSTSCPDSLNALTYFSGNDQDMNSPAILDLYSPHHKHNPLLVRSSPVTIPTPPKSPIIPFSSLDDITSASSSVGSEVELSDVDMRIETPCDSNSYSNSISRHSSIGRVFSCEPLSMMASTQGPINGLPNELLLQIISYLSHSQVQLLSTVNRCFYRFINDPSLYFNLDLSHLGSLMDDQRLLICIKNGFESIVNWEKVDSEFCEVISMPENEVSTALLAGLNRRGSHQRREQRASPVGSVCSLREFLIEWRLPGKTEYERKMKTAIRKRCAWIKSLDLSQTLITNDLLSMLPSFLPSLRSIALDNCSNLTEYGVKQFVVQLPYLTHLSLNNVDHISDNFLFTFVSVCSSLIYLDLSWCDRLTCSGVSSLRQSKYLETLKLSGCVCVGSKAIESVVMECKFLKKLDLEMTCAANSLLELLMMRDRSGSCDSTEFDSGLVRFKFAPNLLHLDIRWCFLTSSKCIKKFTHLREGCKVLSH